MADFEINIRRKIISAKPGETHTLPIGPLDIVAVQRRAKIFAREKGYPIEVLECAEGFRFRRLEAEQPRQTAFSEMDSLQVGGSHLFQVPPELHQRVRLAASARNRTGRVALSCRREGDFIRVTRLPVTNEELAAYTPSPKQQRTSRYGLERLAEQREIDFPPMPFAELRNLRVHVSNKGRLEGWRLTCRVQPDDSVKVTRLDFPEARHG